MIKGIAMFKSVCVYINYIYIYIMVGGKFLQIFCVCTYRCQVWTVDGTVDNEFYKVLTVV